MPDARFQIHTQPALLEVVTAKCEPSLKDAKPELRYQFERLAYFALDKDTIPGKLVLESYDYTEGCVDKGNAEGIVLTIIIRMKKLLSYLMLCFAIITLCHAQSIYERIPNNGQKLAVLLLGCHGKNIKGFGSASLFFAPISTNKEAAKIICAVTALHNLKDKETGEMFDSLCLKISMPPEAKPRYLKLPLKHDSPKNYWVSPSGLDLAVIPFTSERHQRVGHGDSH